MLDLKTKHGTFGNFTSLYLYMVEEKIDNVEVTANYFFNDIATVNLTLEQVEKLSKEGK